MKSLLHSFNAHFLTYLEPEHFRETAFSAFPNISPVSSFQEKRRHFGGEQKLSSPGGLCTTLRTSIRFFEAPGQSFSVIFTPHSSIGRAECKCLIYFFFYPPADGCLSYVYRFQLIFHSSMPLLALSSCRPSNTGKPVLLCRADSDLSCTIRLY